MKKMASVFRAAAADPARLEELASQAEPRRRYLIAMTPRSGSSFLCDVMGRLKRFGDPGEALNQEFIPEIMKRFPGRTPEEYLRNWIRGRKSRNGIAGLKASWYQFNNFRDAMGDDSYLHGFRYIYLTRRDLAAQAVSLYKATATQVFHTNIEHSEAALASLAKLEYDYLEIDRWRQHIEAQEHGWRDYFQARRIFPLCISYEEVEQDVLQVIRRIATFVGVQPGVVVPPPTPSVFEKVGDERNGEWALRYLAERARRAAS